MSLEPVYATNNRHEQEPPAMGQAACCPWLALHPTLIDLPAGGGPTWQWLPVVSSGLAGPTPQEPRIDILATVLILSLSNYSANLDF